MIAIKNITAKSAAMLSLGLPALAAAAFLSCATKIPEPVPDYRSMVSFRTASGAVKLIGPDAALFEIDLTLENKSPVAFFYVALERSLEVDGAVVDPGVDAAKPASGSLLAAAGELEIALAAEIKLSPIPQSAVGGGMQPESSWRLVTNALLEDAQGNAFRVSGETAGAFPRVIVPAMSIESITVRKMELINTKLKVDIVVRNENRFPLILDAFDYALYGEGRFWARGRTAEEIVVGARSDKKIALELVMNFADMDRSVLDKVIYMKQVLCRLTGKIRLKTGLEFLPAFDLPFSIESEAPVAR